MARETGLGLHTGTDHEFEFEILTDDDAAVQDITGWELSFQIRPSADSDTILIEKTTSDGITIAGTYHVSPTNNEQVATVAMDAADTEDFDSSTAVWELKRTDSGSETILGFGPFVFTQSVHHD